MNRVIDYFENLDKKNYIMLIISVLIITFLAVYYINSFFSKKENYLFIKEMNLIKKIRETKVLNYKILKIKKKNSLLKTKLKNLQKDLIYLLSEIESSTILTINDKYFLTILYSYINEGKNINASFNINEKKDLNKYNINITGNFEPDRFLDFAYFIKTIESPKAIITINNLDVFKNKKFINYDINVTIWSFK